MKQTSTKKTQPNKEKQGKKKGHQNVKTRRGLLVKTWLFYPQLGFDLGRRLYGHQNAHNLLGVNLTLFAEIYSFVTLSFKKHGNGI